MSLSARTLRGVLPLPAVIVGALVAHRSGVPFTAFLPNVLAMAVGCAFLFTVRGRPTGRATTPSAIVALVLLALTLLFGGADGVRRWLPLGPLALNVSTVVAPWLLFAVAVTARPMLALTFAFLPAAIVAGQPDAGQGLSYGVAAAFLVGTMTSASRAVRAAGVLSIGVAVVVALARHDTLDPVAHVERILGLAWAGGPGWTCAAIGSLALLTLPALVAARGHDERARLGIAYAGYLLATVLVTELGAFPVPVLGAGAGPVLGWYLMVDRLGDPRPVDIPSTLRERAYDSS